MGHSPEAPPPRHPAAVAFASSTTRLLLAHCASAAPRAPMPVAGAHAYAERGPTPRAWCFCVSSKAQPFPRRLGRWVRAADDPVLGVIPFRGRIGDQDVVAVFERERQIPECSVAAGADACFHMRSVRVVEARFLCVASCCW